MIPTLITTVSAPLIGSLAPSPVTLDPAAVSVTVGWDISNHLSGNSASMIISADVSLDGGATWQNLGSGGRDKGYDLIKDKHGVTQTQASITLSLPGVGLTGRQLRVTLSSSQSVTTFITASQS